LHQVGDLFELNVKFRCQKVNKSLFSISQARSMHPLLLSSYAFTTKCYASMNVLAGLSKSHPSFVSRSAGRPAGQSAGQAGISPKDQHVFVSSERLRKIGYTSCDVSV